MRDWHQNRSCTHLTSSALILNFSPDLFFPILWIGLPFWVLFLLLILKKRQSKKTVWGFLLPIQEGASSHSKLSWPWWRLLILCGAGGLCLYCLSLPYQQKILLHLVEPSLLKQLNQTEKQAFGQKLLAQTLPNLQVQAQTPKGNFYFKSQNYESLYKHDFSNHRSETWYETDALTHQLILNAGLSLARNGSHTFQLTKHEAINSLGIFGVYAENEKLILAIWSKLINTPIQLSYADTQLELPAKPWQTVELPKQALGQTLSLKPFDEYSLDNTIDLNGFQLQNLRWSSRDEMPNTWKELLQSKTMWVEHQKLTLTFNRPNHLNSKSIHLITKPFDHLSLALPSDLYKHLYSTLHLNQSSRHHSLNWPLNSSLHLCLLLPQESQPLWFNENHTFGFQRGSNIYTSLHDSAFKSKLNQKAMNLLLCNLYPNLNSPWLIRRDGLQEPSFSLTQKNIPFEFYNFYSSLALLFTALLGIGFCLKPLKQ